MWMIFFIKKKILIFLYYLVFVVVVFFRIGLSMLEDCLKQLCSGSFKDIGFFFVFIDSFFEIDIDKFNNGRKYF